MRIWDIDPGFLNDKSLLGEHRELHGIVSIHVNGKKGYARHPETIRWKFALTGLWFRHELLVREMGLRGFNHHSPLDPLGQEIAWPDIFIDPPHAQFLLLEEKYRDKSQGRIPLPKNMLELWACHKYSVMARDPECYRSMGPRVASGQISFEDLSLKLAILLRTRPRSGRLVNALEHMWGYVSDKSHVHRIGLGPGLLFREIQTLAIGQKVEYLCRSTALGELGAWLQESQNN